MRQTVSVRTDRRERLSSYRQLAVVVPAIVVVLLVGGAVAIVNGHTADGLIAIGAGLLGLVACVWFVRLPVSGGDEG